MCVCVCVRERERERGRGKVSSSFIHVFTFHRSQYSGNKPQQKIPEIQAVLELVKREMDIKSIFESKKKAQLATYFAKIIA